MEKRPRRGVSSNLELEEEEPNNFANVDILAILKLWQDICHNIGQLKHNEWSMQIYSIHDLKIDFFIGILICVDKWHGLCF